MLYVGISSFGSFFISLSNLTSLTFSSPLLEKGDYYLAVGENAHDALNNIEVERCAAREGVFPIVAREVDKRLLHARVAVDVRHIELIDDRHSYGAGTYILEKGDYYLAVGDNAHDALNNILAAKNYTVADGMDYNGDKTLVYKETFAQNDFEKYSKTKTGETVVNQFDMADVNRNAGLKSLSMIRFILPVF